jgi:glycosyltransferase involved in cell wall biosynthesis
VSTQSNPGDGLRVCIVAEHASFRFGGEASLPLHYFTRIRARGVEAWLIVHARTKRELEVLLPGDQGRIQYIPDRWYHRLIFRLSRALPRRVSEATLGTLMLLLNQCIQRGIARRLIRDEGINVVHQPIPVSPKAPSFIAGLGVPVVIGPMNGGMEYPPAFRGAESWFTRVTVAIGRGSANVINVLIPGKKYAALLLVANQRTRLALPQYVRGSVLEMPENAVDLTIWNLDDKQDTATTRFLVIARLVDWKRVDFVMEALARVPQAELEIIGDGPMRCIWAELAGHLGIADRVRFKGWLTQSECAERLHGAVALLLPSLYECGGAVVLEAMACGVPVVATAWGGPVDYIDDTCGFLVDTTDSEAIIQGFAEAMSKLITRPELRAQLGGAGRRRVEDHFDWDKKIDQILQLYERAIEVKAS